MALKNKKSDAPGRCSKRLLLRHCSLLRHWSIELVMKPSSCVLLLQHVLQLSCMMANQVKVNRTFLLPSAARRSEYTRTCVSIREGSKFLFVVSAGDPSKPTD